MLNTSSSNRSCDAKTPIEDVVLRCEQLTKRYPGNILAVNKLDLSVCRGEIFGLLGPNGAGKTTTVGMLTTLVTPTGGRAYVAGIDVIAKPALVKQVIGVVSQTNNLDRALTVWENLYYHGLFFGMKSVDAKAAADKSLVDFHLTERAKADVMTISGGMAKRLMLARALLHNPSILFLDEPTAGLDPQSRLVLWEIVNNLHKEGQTILLTTHYMEEADSMCSRLAIMDHGHILAMDSPKALKSSIAADTIVNVSTNGDFDKLSVILSTNVEGMSGSKKIGNTLQLQFKGVTGIVPRIFAAAEKNGFQITDISISEPSLETVFINLTGKELRD